MGTLHLVAGGMSAVISLSGAGKLFGGRRVLENVSAEIGASEFVSILGPSGCGKSTLLRLIAGLVPFEEGHIRFNGADVTAPSADMGFVFQTSNLLPWLNVRDNLLLGVDLDPAAKRPDAAALADLVETLGLTGFEDSHPHQLSGGMRHRVAIGQALARGPQVLLMDEPFGALDALTRDRLNMELLRIWQRDRKTVVLVTHSIAEAVLLSDRVLVMSERPGTIVEDVRIDLPRPRDPSVTRENPAFGDYVVRLSKLMGVA
ncbi:MULTISPECIES: ABC transporter ATP-binding protein [Sphingopyxis]|uniref:ABC transporter ATP-binding protein n=2 Tax=Sphingopyxis TaxID=165697 RepID=UPI0020D1AC9B|nr:MULTISPECIES: ABC transporter ATP-binding protein [Sphingopyxis]